MTGKSSLRLPKGAKVLASEGRLLVVLLAAPPKGSQSGPTARPGRLEQDRVNAEQVREVVAGADAPGIRASQIAAATRLTASPSARAIALAVAEGWIRRRGNGLYVHADVPAQPWEKVP